MFFSRVTTLAKLDFLSDLIPQTNPKQNRLEFFFVGRPPQEPVTPEGTILVKFDMGFLSRNWDLFEWGSVGDSGGIRNGYNKFIPKELYKDVRLNGIEFEKALRSINKLEEPQKKDLLARKPVPRFIELNKSTLHHSVVEALGQSEFESDWSIEFCLRGAPVLTSDQITKMCMPNVYRNLPVARSLKNHLKGKLKFYNPRRSVHEFA